MKVWYWYRVDNGANDFLVIKAHFLYSFCVNGHLSCFYVLAFINNAAVNTAVQIRFWGTDFIFFRYIPRSGISGSYSDSIYFFNFWGTSVLFSMMAVLIYIPTNSAQGLSFLHIFVNTCYLLSFW